MKFFNYYAVWYVTNHVNEATNNKLVPDGNWVLPGVSGYPLTCLRLVLQLSIRSRICYSCPVFLAASSNVISKQSGIKLSGAQWPLT